MCDLRDMARHRLLITVSLCAVSALRAMSVHAQSLPVVPPIAAKVEGPIEQIELGPILRERYVCMEHSLGELVYAGDALGTDCMSVGGAPAEPYIKFYRTDGRENADWYGWRSEVLAPSDGEVAFVSSTTEINVPGKFGRPPGGGVRIRTRDGVIVILGHLSEITVKLGDHVSRGQVIGRVGNNGMARAPHTHVGAYRETTATPLQVRWNLRAMAEERARAGEERCPGCKEAAERNASPARRDTP